MEALGVLSDLWDLLGEVFSSIGKWFDSIADFFSSMLSSAEVGGIIGVLIVLLAIKLLRG